MLLRASRKISALAPLGFGLSFGVVLVMCCCTGTALWAVTWETTALLSVANTCS